MAVTTSEGLEHTGGHCDGGQCWEPEIFISLAPADALLLPERPKPSLLLPESPSELWKVKVLAAQSLCLAL